MTANDSPPPLVPLVIFGLFVVAFFGAPYVSELIGAYRPREQRPSAFTWLPDGGIE